LKKYLYFVIFYYTSRTMPLSDIVIGC